MLITKSRKQGNSVVVTLPSNKHNKPTINKEYIVIYCPDDTITLVPKISDPFIHVKQGAFYEQDEWKDITPDGRELL